MTVENGGKPGDERGFIHKKLLSGLGSIAGLLPIPGAGVVSTIARTLGGSRTVPRTQTARPTQFSAAEREVGRQLKFGGNGNGNGDGCVFPWRRDPRTGDCRIFVGDRSGPDGDRGAGPGGPRGRGGMPPEVMTIQRSVCGRKEVLGDDGLCYHKSQISNKQRMWPRGRQPLLTGGEMRAIGIASRAGGKMERATKRLQKMGMMKKPSRRGPARAHHHHPAA